jgi:hypothetical protein
MASKKQTATSYISNTLKLIEIYGGVLNGCFVFGSSYSNFSTENGCAEKGFMVFFRPSKKLPCKI